MNETEFAPYSIYFRITDKCNLNCAHCCYESSSERESMKFEDVKRVINNFPKDTERVVISGGEVFTNKILLYETLEYIQEYKKDLFPGVSVVVQSNASWVDDKDDLLTTLRELNGKGVDTFNWSGMIITTRSRD